MREILSGSPLSGNEGRHLPADIVAVDSVSIDQQSSQILLVAEVHKGCQCTLWRCERLPHTKLFGGEAYVRMRSQP